MNRLLLKEFLLGIFILSVGLFLFKRLEIDIYYSWIYLSALLFVLFAFGTLILNYFLIKKNTWLNFAFIGVTFFKQLVLLILLFVFLEPKEGLHRIVAKSGIAAYLIFLGFDTYWKVKWLFTSRNDGAAK